MELGLINDTDSCSEVNYHVDSCNIATNVI